MLSSLFHRRHDRRDARIHARDRQILEGLESRVLLSALPNSAFAIGHSSGNDLSPATNIAANLSAVPSGSKKKNKKITTASTLAGVDVFASGTGQTVVGRYLVYGGTPLQGDAAAPDKTALLPGQAASFFNVSSYSKGINEILIDVSNGAASYSASDFTFRAGLTGDPSTWAAAPAPYSITTTPGAGLGGSTRITIRWTDGAIVNQWLQVSLNAAGDTFYYGNLPGDTGGASGNPLVVSALDENAVRQNPMTLLSSAPLTSVYDFNRDGKVNSIDALIARKANGDGLSNFVAPVLVTQPVQEAYDWHTETINGVLNVWAPNPGDFGATFAVTDPAALFGSDGVPQITALHQGPIADCYFLAAAGSVALSNPGRIESIEKNDTGGGWAVTFQYWNQNTGTYQPVVIHTDDELSSTLQYEANGEVWVMVLEKAYAAFRTWNGSTSTNTMASLGWGFPGVALSALNDNNLSISYGMMTNAALASTIQNDLAANEPLLFQTSTSAPDMVQSHVYVITGISTDAGGTVWVTTYNPWGFYDTRSESDLISNGIGSLVVGTA